jgi:hypothetical protein
LNHLGRPDFNSFHPPFFSLSTFNQFISPQSEVFPAKMRSFSFMVALFFALVSSTYAWPELHLLETRKGGKNNGTSTKGMKGNGTRGNSINGQCKQMAKLTKLTELASNQTKLDAMVAKGKINATEVEAIKTKATEATTKLATLTSNTTLVSECLVVDAHKKLVGQCKQMKKLTKLADLATNTTAKDAMVAKKELNATQITKLDEKIANATTKLTELMSNTTLTDLCTAEQSNKGTADTGKSTSSLDSGSLIADTCQVLLLRLELLPLLPAVPVEELAALWHCLLKRCLMCLLQCLLVFLPSSCRRPAHCNASYDADEPSR